MCAIGKARKETPFALRLAFAALGVAVLMLIDNIWEIKTAWSTANISIYYLFFNAIVFSGIMSSYLIPVLCCLPWNMKNIKQRGKTMEKMTVGRKARDFFIATACGGLAVSLGYGFFVGICSLKFPFASDDVIEAGMTIFPYVSYSLNGYVGLHLFIMLLNGFLLGALYGGMSATFALFTLNESVVILIPFMVRFLWIQLYRIIPIEYNDRIDYWLFMRTSYSEELQTPFFAIGRVLLILIVFLIVYLVKSKQEVIQQ